MTIGTYLFNARNRRFYLLFTNRVTRFLQENKKSDFVSCPKLAGAVHK